MNKRAGGSWPTYAIALTAGLASAIAALGLSAAVYVLQLRRNLARAFYVRPDGAEAKFLNALRKIRMHSWQHLCQVCAGPAQQAYHQVQLRVNWVGASRRTIWYTGNLR